MSSPARVSYTSAGGQPGPFRAALLKEARKHLGKPKIRYMIVAGKHISAYLDCLDWKNIEIWASSRVEAVVAFLDFLNDNLRSVPAGSEPDIYDDNYRMMRGQLDQRTTEEFIRDRVSTAHVDYFRTSHAYYNYWLTEWPEETRRITVPELLSSPEGAEGDGAAAPARD